MWSIHISFTSCWKTSAQLGFRTRSRFSSDTPWYHCNGKANSCYSNRILQSTILFLKSLKSPCANVFFCYLMGSFEFLVICFCSDVWLFKTWKYLVLINCQFLEHYSAKYRCAFLLITFEFFCWAKQSKPKSSAFHHHAWLFWNVLRKLNLQWNFWMWCLKKSLFVT